MVDRGNAVEFRLCPKEAMGTVVAAVFIAGLAAALGLYQNEASGLVLAGAVGVIGVGLFGFHYLVTRIDRSVKLRIDMVGMHSAKLFVRSARWSEISRVVFVQMPRGTLKMKVFVGGAGPGPGQSFLDGMWKVLGRGRINLEVEDLEGEPDDIIAAIKRFSPNTPVGY